MRTLQMATASADCTPSSVSAMFAHAQVTSQCVGSFVLLQAASLFSRRSEVPLRRQVHFLLLLLLLPELVHIRVLQVALGRAPHVTYGEEDTEIEQVPERVEGPERVPPRIEATCDDHEHLPSDPHTRSYNRSDQDVREAPVQLQLGRLPARRELSQGASQPGEDPPIEECVEDGHRQDEAQAERHGDGRELRDIGGDVEDSGEDEVDDTEKEHAICHIAQRRPHDAVSEAHGENQQPRQRLLARGYEHAENDRSHPADAAAIEALVIKVPHPCLHQPQQKHAADVRLQRQQHGPVPDT
mmetsp:Transcript_14247/g.32534  ORF Transcript_14247/g.32534 Transcript_14247/m.32534 type:complete len:299 (-) Transcript_14247:654-1550(-)